MSKTTVSGVCLRAFDAEPSRVFGLSELHAMCVAAGLAVEVAQVYAGVQSLASTSKCDRGPEKQTWCRLGSGRGKSEPTPSADGSQRPEPRRRRLSSAVTYDVTQILEQVEALLGPRVPRPPDKLAYCHGLDGEHCFEDIMDRARRVLGQQPASWFSFNIGPTVALGFLPAEKEVA